MMKPSFYNYYIQTIKNIFSNVSVMSVMILSVIFYGFFYPTAYKGQVPDNLPIVIVDEEQSPLSTAIINSSTNSAKIQVYTVTGNFLEAKQLVQQKKADAILYLPADMTDSFRKGGNGGIGLYLSAAYLLEVKQITRGLGLAILDAIHDNLSGIGEINTQLSFPVVHDIPLYNTVSGYGNYVFPSIATLIVHQTLMMGISTLLAGYREEKWKAKPKEWWGIYIALLTIGMATSLYLYGFIFWLYDYPRGGNFWGMLVALPIFLSAVIGLAMILGSYLDIPERSAHVLAATSVPLFLLTGLSWPLESMPTSLAWLSRLLPSTEGVDLFVQLNQMGSALTDVWGKLVYLGVLAVLCLSFGYYRLSRCPRYDSSNETK